MRLVIELCSHKHKPPCLGAQYESTDHVNTISNEAAGDGSGWEVRRRSSVWELIGECRAGEVMREIKINTNTLPPFDPS